MRKYRKIEPKENNLDRDDSQDFSKDEDIKKKDIEKLLNKRKFSRLLEKLDNPKECEITKSIIKEYALTNNPVSSPNSIFDSIKSLDKEGLDGLNISAIKICFQEITSGFILLVKLEILPSEATIEFILAKLKEKKNIRDQSIKELDGNTECRKAITNFIDCVNKSTQNESRESQKINTITEEHLSLFNIVLLHEKDSVDKNFLKK